MGQLYAKGVDSTYWTRVDMLNRYVYNKDINVVPYTPDMPYTFVDFYPTFWNSSSDTYMKVYIDGVLLNSDLANPSVKIMDILGTIYFTYTFKYGTTKISIKDSSDNEIKTYEFICINSYLFYTLQSQDEMDILIEYLKKKGDLILDDCRDAQLANNFGNILAANKPNDFTFPEYRTVLDSYKDAFLKGSTIGAIKDIVHDVTGTYPTLTYWSAVEGWHVFNFNKWIAGPTSTKSIKEIVYKSTAGTGTDHLSQLMSTGPAIIYRGIETYVLGVDYTLGISGSHTTVSWTSGAHQPSLGDYYFVEYDYVDSTQTHYYAHDIQDDDSQLYAKPGLKVYSGMQHENQLMISIPDSDRAIVGEIVTKSETDGGFEVLQNTPLVMWYVNNEALVKGTDDTINYTPIVPASVAPVRIVYSGTVYNETTDFTLNRNTGVITWVGAVPPTSATYSASYYYGAAVVTQGPTTFVEGYHYLLDRVSGKITWNTSVTQPAKSSQYTVTYNYIPKYLIETALDKAKPAHIKLIYEYLP